MKRLTWLIPFFLLATLNAAAPSSITRDGTAALTSFLQAAVRRGDVPGVVAMVVNKDGVLYHDAAGKLNVARSLTMPKDAIFRIASMTKPVTSVAIMMLVEEGKLKVDDEVSKYLPAFKERQVFTSVNDAAGTYETRPASRPITIRHLLTHTSGIGYAWSDKRLALAMKKTGAVSEMELPLLHEPGEKWSYGASTRVLGEVVEKLSGQKIDMFLESRIAKPLGMNDTTFTVPRAT
jgi:methyl acetate hydrolase